MDRILERMAARRPARLAAGLALLACLAGPVLAASEIGTAQLVVNNVYGNSLNKRMKDGETLVFDQTVKTGRESAARLKLVDESSVTIGERSEIVLDELVYDPAKGIAAGSIELAKGVFRFASGQVKLDVTIHTHHADIGIRGTRFDVYETADATEVAVHEGIVEVTSPQGTELVEAGQFYRVTDDEAGFEPEAPEEMQAAVDDMLVLVETADGTPAEKATETTESSADTQVASGRHRQEPRQPALSGHLARPHDHRDAPRSGPQPRRPHQGTGEEGRLRRARLPQRQAGLRRRDRRPHRHRERRHGRARWPPNCPRSPSCAAPLA